MITLLVFLTKELGGFVCKFYEKPEDYISDKDKHPNAKGHQVIAEAIYERLG